jgi:hypothetical protein
MTNTLQQLEARLWGSEHDCQVIMLVPASEMWLIGTSLSIVGGTRIANWRSAIASTPPDGERLHVICNARAEHVRWQENGCIFTPLHLRRADRAPDNVIVNASEFI